VVNTDEVIDACGDQVYAYINKKRSKETFLFSCQAWYGTNYGPGCPRLLTHSAAIPLIKIPVLFAAEAGIILVRGYGAFQ
jgi:hypothetical protein